MTVRLPPAVRRAIAGHARLAQPNECCGFLVGRGSRVQFACAMTNVDRAPARGYRVDDSEHIALRRVLRSLTPPLEIVGVYHSHPLGAARPSARDIREANYPDWIHVIVGFRAARAVIYAYRIRRGQVIRLPIGDGRGSRSM